MLEATRLTRAGRLAEATALLQGHISTTAASDPLSGRHPGGVAVTFRAWFERAGRFYRAKHKEPVPEPNTTSEIGQFLARSYRSDAGTRDYRLYVPSGYRGEPVPLVVMLHGCKQTAEDFAAGTRMNVHAEALTCLAVYPEQSAAANGSRCWNWFKPEHQQRGLGEAAVIAGITEQVMRDYAVDERRVSVAGLSAGGAAAAIVGSAYADLYAAVGIHSGLARGAAHDVASAFAAMRQGGATAHPSTAAPTRPIRLVPTIVFHGDRDRTVNPRNGEEALAQAMGASDLEKRVERGQAPGGHAYSIARYSDRNGIVMFESWLIHGAGHAWSGGDPAGSYTDPQGPDAAAEMLRFFFDHPQPCTA
jgi:poly(hydroxyalkanoate) depolymerase family esterase